MRRVLAFSALGSLFAGMGQAQPVPADLQAAQSAIQQQQSAQSEADRVRREAQRSQKASTPGPIARPDPFAPVPGGPCFVIGSVVISGHEAFGKKPAGADGLPGTCATAADIGAALNRINQDYQALGFITTRAYVPEQDLSQGVLDIRIVAGRVEGYVYGDGAQADARIKAAFPGARGDLLNLRNLEQGLDNLNGPKSANATFQLVPGAEPGGSFVQVAVEDKRPWHLNLNVDNTGFATTGLAKTSLNLGLDNVLGLNDQLSLGVTTTPFDARRTRYSDAYSASWNVAMGNWLFGLDIGKSGYRFILPGINQSYPVAGRSHYGTISAERLLMRSQTAKVYAYGNLKLTRTRSFIDEQEIETQRRRLSIGSLGLRGEKTLSAGKLTWDVGTKFGMKAFGAYVLDKSIVDPAFRLLKASLNYERPLRAEGSLYKAALTAQYSNDILPGTEQMSIGSWSTVRGFHDDSMYGDNGMYLRNTLEWDAFKGADIDLRMNAGLDLGYVKPSKLRRWSQDYLMGVSLGADVRIRKQTTLTVQLARALRRPEQNPPNAQPAFEAKKTVGFAGLKVEF